MPSSPITPTELTDVRNLIDQIAYDLLDAIQHSGEPLSLEIATNERDLADVYRPLIAAEGMELEETSALLNQAIVDTLAPIQSALLEAGYDLSAVMSQSGVTTEMLLPPVSDTMPSNGSAEFATYGPDPNAFCPVPLDTWLDATGRPFESLLCHGGRWYWVGSAATVADDGRPMWPVFLDGANVRCSSGLIEQYTYKGGSLYACNPGGPIPEPEPLPSKQPVKPPQPPVLTLPPVDTARAVTTPIEPLPVPQVEAPLELWEPCAANFPARIKAIVEMLREIGSQVVQFVTDVLESGADLLHGARDAGAALARLWNLVVSKLPDLNPLLKGGAFDVLRDPQVLTTILKGGEQVERLIREIVSFYREPRVIKYVGDKQALLGVWTIRGLLQAYEDSSFGWEFGPQALVNLRISYTQINEILDHVVWYMWPVKIPELPDVESLYMAGALPDEHIRLFVELHGYDWLCKWRSMHTRRSQLTEDQLTQLYFRGDLNREQYDKAMRAKGWLEPDEVKQFVDAATFIPTPSDAIRFAVRDVFDPNKLGRAEMEAELRQQKGLEQAFAAAGIKPVRIKPEGMEELDYDVPLAYWLASFEEASPSQTYLGLQRLRPNRVERYRQLVTDAELATNPALLAGATKQPGPQAGQWWVIPNPVTLNTVNKLLKEKDYNPIWRGMLAAISYRVTGRIDTKRFYKLGALGEPRYTAGFDGKPGADLKAVGPAEIELYEMFQDQGYSPADAIVHAYAVAAEVEATNNNARLKAERSLVCAAYTEGVYDREKALAILAATGFDPVQSDAYLRRCDGAAALRTVKVAKAAVRKGFMRGQYDETTARRLLTQFGVTQRVVDQAIKEWMLQRDSQQREATASQLCGFVSDGTLTYADMATRLRNLNYRQEDINRVVRHCQLGHLAKTTKERDRLLAAQQRERIRLEGVEERKREKLATEQRRALRDFLVLQSQKNIQEWLAACLITEDDVREMYRIKGANPTDVERQLELWRGENRCEQLDSE